MTYNPNEADSRVVAFLVPEFLVGMIDRAAEASLINRSTFLRMAIWRDLQREGWATAEVDENA
jgi:predicted transcriptional regulator